MQDEPPRDRTQQAFLDHFVDLTSRVAHEFNNVLNSIMLQLALFEQRGLKPETYPELAALRQMATGAAAMIRQFQQLVHRQHGTLRPLDLNAVVQQAVEAWQQEDRSQTPVQAEWAPDLPLVLGNQADLTRLVQLLLSSAAAAMAGAGGPIQVRTEPAGQQVRLRVEDAGPSLAPEQLLRLFDPFAVRRPGGAGWEMAVCKALAGRLRGTCRGENRSAGGLAIDVELRVASA